MEEKDFSSDPKKAINTNSQHSTAYNKDSDEITFKDLFNNINSWARYIKSKVITILIVAIIGGLAGCLFSILKKPVYIAELSFALEDEQSGGGLGNALGLASQFGLDLGGGRGGAFSGDNLLELMKSRLMVEKTLLTPVKINGKLQTLAEYYIDFKGLRKKWVDKPQLRGIHFYPGKEKESFTRMQDSLLGEFHKDIIDNDLVVDKKDAKLSIISVTIKSKNELFSKFFAEILVKEVSEFYVETKTKRSFQNVLVLQHQTDSVRRQLNGAITGVAASIDINPNPNPSRQILRVPSQRRQVDVQANQAILTELVKNLELSKVALRKETPLIQIIDYPILPLEKKYIKTYEGFIYGFILFGILAFLTLVFKRIIQTLSS